VQLQDDGNGAFEAALGIAQGQHAGDDGLAQHRALDLAADDETLGGTGTEKNGPLGSAEPLGQWQRRAHRHAAGVHARNVGEVLHADQRRTQHRVAIGTDGADVADVGQRARDLFGRCQQGLLVAGRGLRRLLQAVVHLGDVDARTLEALQDADDSDGKQSGL